MNFETISVSVDRRGVAALTLRRHAQVFQQALSGLNNPLIAFAVKANPNVAVLTLLGKEGLGADVVSVGEMRRALAAGIPANRIVFSEKFACPVSGFTIPEIEPRLFSFNAPLGACPACDGLGAELVFDERLIVPDSGLSLAQGANQTQASGA